MSVMRISSKLLGLGSALLMACVEPSEADLSERDGEVEQGPTGEPGENSSAADASAAARSTPRFGVATTTAGMSKVPTGGSQLDAGAVREIELDAGTVRWVDGGSKRSTEASAGECWNHPPSTFQSDAWVAQAVDPANLVALFERTRASMVGAWHGVVATPWLPPYDVDIAFRADGSYSAHCSGVADDCCVAFYYGTNADSDIKRYRIEDATLSGNVVGEIDIAFGYDGNFGLPAWQGMLSHVELDGSGNALRFEFRTSSGYGPLRYDLRRVSDQ
jgi:hypothetical protein